jgi:hypothetical protein
MTETLILVLKSGEQIITEVETPFATEEDVMIRKPLRILPQPDGRITLMPWIVGSRAEIFPIKKSSIVTYAPAEAKAEKIYKDLVSAIKIPPPGTGKMLLLEKKS